MPTYVIILNPTNFKEFISKEDYEIFAGADWPPYNEFVQNNRIEEPSIKIEIDEFLKAMNENYLAAKLAQQHKRANNLQTVVKFLSYSIVPAVVGLCLFAVNFSSWINFFSILLAFWFVNLLHNVAMHRWLSHEQFEPKWYVRPLLLWNLTLVGCWRPMTWVNTHKSHHFNTDTEFDPYPPSIGFWRLLFGLYQPHRDYQLTTELQQKDIQFVDKYYYWLYTANLIVFFLVDPNIVFLSFAFLKLYTYVNNAIQNWMLHGSDRNGQPSNIPVLYEFLFSGDGLHKNHHEKPFAFNYGFKERSDPVYFLIRFLAKKAKR